LHEAALLVVEGGALLAEEAEFGVGGIEDGGDGALLFNVAWDANLFSQEDDGIKDEFFDVDTGAGDASEPEHPRGLREPSAPASV
jgi:hypothetical protein